MTRDLIPNPDFPSRSIMRIAVWHPPMVAEFDSCLPAAMPAGFHGEAWRDSDGRICIGIKPDVPAANAPVPAATKPDTLDSKSLADLQTLAGRKGVKYTKETPIEDLRANLRAKGVRG
jgi:hypothetical protein